MSSLQCVLNYKRRILHRNVKRIKNGWNVFCASFNSTAVNFLITSRRFIPGNSQDRLFSGSSAQRARANLYGALLNYLRIGRSDDSTSMSDSGRLRKANCDVLSSFGDVFIDVVCRDAVSGHDVRKMLALSLLVGICFHRKKTSLLNK
jgi:hypothetical protein